jgi:cytochrome c556
VIRYKSILASTLLASILSATAVAQADGAEDAIKARQGFMRLNGFNMGRLAAMAKGEADYDAETATQAAQNLLMLAKMKNGAMWPANSGNNVAALTDKTRALSEIWSTYPEIANKNAELLSALEEFVSVAGKDLASMRVGLKTVGQSCGGCHKKFRAEKE